MRDCSYSTDYGYTLDRRYPYGACPAMENAQMHWKRTLQLIDVHCEGEIGRVITSGVLDVPGETMADKQAHMSIIHI